MVAPLPTTGTDVCGRGGGNDETGTPESCVEVSCRESDLHGDGRSGHRLSRRPPQLRGLDAFPDASRDVPRLPYPSPADEADDPGASPAAGRADPAPGPRRAGSALPDVEEAIRLTPPHRPCAEGLPQRCSPPCDPAPCTCLAPRDGATLAPS